MESFWNFLQNDETDPGKEAVSSEEQAVALPKVPFSGLCIQDNKID